MHRIGARSARPSPSMEPQPILLQPVSNSDSQTNKHHYHSQLSPSHRQFVQVPIMACYVLLIDVFSNPRSDVSRNNLAFLGMAGGWFGRLATTTPNCVAFDELMELIALAQQQRKG